MRYCYSINMVQVDATVDCYKEPRPNGRQDPEYAPPAARVGTVWADSAGAGIREELGPSPRVFLLPP